MANTKDTKKDETGAAVAADELTSESPLIKQEVDAKAAEAVAEESSDGGGSIETHIHRLNESVVGAQTHGDIDAVETARQIALADERRQSEERANANRVVDAQNLVQRHGGHPAATPSYPSDEEAFAATTDATARDWEGAGGKLADEQRLGATIRVATERQTSGAPLTPEMEAVLAEKTKTAKK